MGRAVVVGAGIGGLTSAVALAQAGWDVTVVERAQSLDPVGAGLGVAPNALHALDALGLGEALRARAAIQGDAGIRRPSGRWIYRTSDAAIRRRFGDPLVVALRSDLVEVLVGALPDGVLRLGTPVSSVGVRSGDVELEDGTSLPADLVVAADGVRSGIRALAFPASAAVRPLPIVAWRFLAPRPVGLVPAETWGLGALVGVVPLADGRVYVYTGLRVPVDAEIPPLPTFDGWHAPVPQLFAGAQAVISGRLVELQHPLPALHQGRAALVGDAAHPMAPFLAQGACQAIEDAVTLARVVDPRDVQGTLPRYTAARRARTQAITTRSRRVGSAILRPNRLGCAIRDAAASAVRLLPDDALARSFDGVFSWQPPAHTVPSS